MERVYTYSGTVAGLRLQLESSVSGLLAYLGLTHYRMNSLFREAMPTPNAAEWQLLDDKAHDDR